MKDRSALPELVLCSPAVRAHETADLVMPALPEARFEVDDALYSEDGTGLIAWLKILDPDVSSLMVVGHNPTLQELCVMLPSFPLQKRSIRKASPQLLWSSSSNRKLRAGTNSKWVARVPSTGSPQ